MFRRPDRGLFDLRNEDPGAARYAYEQLGVRYIFGVGQAVWTIEPKTGKFTEAYASRTDEPDMWNTFAFSDVVVTAYDQSGRGFHATVPFHRLRLVKGPERSRPGYAVMRKKDLGPVYVSLLGGRYGLHLWKWRNVAALVGTEFYCLGEPWTLWIRCLVKLAIVAVLWCGRPWVLISNSYTPVDLQGRKRIPIPVPAWQIRLWERLAWLAGARIYALLGWQVSGRQECHTSIIEAWEKG